MHNKQLYFITLLSLVIFCLYIFVNILFPYANIISTCFLSISTGLLLYCLFDNNEVLIIISLVCVLLSIVFALLQYLILA